MQNTRLNSIFDLIGTRLEQFFSNPWRRISLTLIALLSGTFLGTAIPTTAGQTAEWDVMVAGVLIILTETISRFVYSRPLRILQPEERSRRSLMVNTLNALKLGLTYSLFVEAFKLGS